MKLKRILLVAFALGLLGAGIVEARSTKANGQIDMFAVFQGGLTHVYELVEQQSCDPVLGCWHQYGSEGTVCNLDPLPEIIVCNNTIDTELDGNNDPASCLWDVDDHTQISWLGDKILAGASVSITKCIVGDSGWVFGMAQSDVDDLTLTIAFDLVGGPDFSLSTLGTQMCVGGPRVRDTSPLRVEIPDSNGGTGIPGTVTWTATNHTDRTWRAGRQAGLSAGSGNLGFSTYDGRFCPEGFPLFTNKDGGDFDENGVEYIWDLP